MSGLSVMMSKGDLPAIISNMSTPRAHQSTLKPGAGAAAQHHRHCSHSSCTSSLTVVFSSQDLRSDVVWRSTEGAGGVSWLDPLLTQDDDGETGLRVRRDLHRPQPHFAHPIICQFDVSIVVQEDVVQLQVAVDDSLLMQKVQSDADFSSIKPEERSSLQPEEPVRNLEPGTWNLEPGQELRNSGLLSAVLPSSGWCCALTWRVLQEVCAAVACETSGHHL